MTLASATPCGPLTLPRLSFIFALVCVLYLLKDIWVPPSPSLVSGLGAQSTIATGLASSTKGQDTAHVNECSTAPGADRVMVVLKVCRIHVSCQFHSSYRVCYIDRRNRDIRQATYSIDHLVSLHSSLLDLFRLGPDLFRLYDS